MKTSNPNSFAARATRYARNVVDGKILASKWIRLACQKHLDDLERPDFRWHFDEKKVQQVCSFIETLQLTETSKFILRDFQVWLVASLIGWIDEDGTRKHIEGLILIPKGNGKSPLAAAIGLWFAFLDGRQNAEVFCGAKSLKQAKEVFNPAINFVDTQSAFGRLGVVAQKTSIYSTRSGSFFQPVIGKGRHGARPYLAILDELHQAISADLYDTFKTGCNKTPNSLMLIISTAGVASLANPCYTLQKEAEKILEGIIENDRIFAAIYSADESVEWDSEEALLMANPNLGISNDAEKIRIAQLEAVRNPAKQNNTKAMHLNLWSTAASAWMNITEWNKCFDPLLTLESVKDLPCWLGNDLASKLDLSATVKLFRRDIDGRPHYYCFTRAYLPEARVNAPENQQYQKWVKQGHLTSTPGSSIDYTAIETDSVDDVATYQVQELAYDARYADQYAQRVADISGVIRVETPPSPAILSPAMKELESAVMDGRFHHDGNPVATFCMSNVLTNESGAGNYSMPSKAAPENKIDAAIALFIAMSRARLFVSNLNDSASSYLSFA